MNLKVLRAMFMLWRNDYCTVHLTHKIYEGYGMRYVCPVCRREVNTKWAAKQARRRARLDNAIAYLKGGHRG